MNGCPLLLEELTKQGSTVIMIALIKTRLNVQFSDAVILNKDVGLAYPLDLNAWLVVKYENDQLSYTSCCNQFQSPYACLLMI